MKNACSIHINFLPLFFALCSLRFALRSLLFALCSLLFALWLFVICGETTYRLCAIEPIAHTLQTGLERPGCLFEGDVYAAGRFFRGRKRVHIS